MEDNVHAIIPAESYRQAAQLLHNQGGSPTMFEDVSRSVGGAGFTKLIVGRGLAIGDYDNDGRMDILIVDSEGMPLLLHNELPTAGRHYLGLRLIGTKSNRDGYGAVVMATLGDGRKLTRFCHADGSYLSASDRRVHIGLDAASRVSSLTVHWPSGQTDTFQDVASDRYVTLREGDPSLH